MMKKFQFSLESVMGYKEQLLSAAKAEVAKINYEIAQLEIEEENLKNEFIQSENNMQEQSRRGITPQMIAYYRNYQENLRRMQQTLEKKKHGLFRERDRSINKMTKMNIEVKSLEKLKEKEWKTYQAASAKEQERIVEEFTVFTRKA